MYMAWSGTPHFRFHRLTSTMSNIEDATRNTVVAHMTCANLQLDIHELNPTRPIQAASEGQANT